MARNENALAKAVADHGPVAVAVDATNIQHYRGGVFNGPCSRPANHQVIVVGYSTDHWLIKNSWGTRWGERGYMRLARNHNNLCQVANEAAYPCMYLTYNQ